MFQFLKSIAKQEEDAATAGRRAYVALITRAAVKDDLSVEEACELKALHAEHGGAEELAAVAAELREYHELAAVAATLAKREKDLAAADKVRKEHAAETARIEAEHASNLAARKRRYREIVDASGAAMAAIGTVENARKRRESIAASRWELLNLKSPEQLQEDEEAAAKIAPHFLTHFEDETPTLENAHTFEYLVHHVDPENATRNWQPYSGQDPGDFAEMKRVVLGLARRQIREVRFLILPSKDYSAGKPHPFHVPEMCVKVDGFVLNIHHWSTPPAMPHFVRHPYQTAKEFKQLVRLVEVAAAERGAGLPAKNSASVFDWISLQGVSEF